MKNLSSPLEAWHSPEGRRIKDSVLGINDGVVTVVSFLGGLTGSALPMHTIFFSGVMSNVAGAISMFLGGYMASRSQRDFYLRESNREWDEIRDTPELEKKEVFDILIKMHFSQEEATLFVQRITKDPHLWHSFMMKEELGLNDMDKAHPLKDGGWLGASFLIGGIPPLLPYAWVHSLSFAFDLSLALSIVVLATLGVIKSHYSNEPAIKGAGEMVILGGSAALAGLFVGTILPKIFHLS
ncbi:MAG: VIT1/CCC1 transporter family protein [Leptospirillum sp.]|jgi:VIT1/CCC1 family predicted Fe2+/Mn2+ transporter